MAEPFLSEIRMFGFGWAPRGWAQCDGQILPINQNQSLYSLLGTTYGGDGRTSFALPDMRSRTPAGDDEQLLQGAKQGIEYVTLTAAEMPAHSHALKATTVNATTKQFTGSMLATAVDKTNSELTNMYVAPSSLVALSPRSVSTAGGGMSHDNNQPSITVNFCIALQGLFPSRN
ncbi:MAG: tail fiber protein [Thalassolituus sp.]|jgi:microcystin-dependent protein|uniref:phage tail protein n=1 Tax=Thalassolituus sp. TaxID=2030822 RepID=UPI00398241B2